MSSRHESRQQPDGQPHRTQHVAGLAAIVLCGGKSSRMGRDKATIVLGGETLLQRVCRQTGEVAGRVIVVTAAGQSMDSGNNEVELVVDESPDCGPLGGFLTGLNDLMSDRKDQKAGLLKVELPKAVCLTGCDTPFVSATVIRNIYDHLEDFDAVVVEQQGQLHPLVGIYNTRVLGDLRASFFAGERSFKRFLQRLKIRKLPSEQVSRNPSWLLNVNTAEDLVIARAACELRH